MKRTRSDGVPPAAGYVHTAVARPLFMGRLCRPTGGRAGQSGRPRRATSAPHEANVTPNMYSARLWSGWLVAWNNEAETKNVSCERMRRERERERGKEMSPGFPDLFSDIL